RRPPAWRRVDGPRVAFDAFASRVPLRADAALLLAILKIGQYPRLDLLVERRPEVYERDASPAPPQTCRRLGRRVAAADHYHVLVERLVPLAVDVAHVRQILARHADVIGVSEVSARADH